MFTASAHAAFVRQLVVAQQATAEMTRKALIRTAGAAEARVIAEQTARAGVPPLERITVDGQIAAGFDGAQAGSRIVLLWQYLREVTLGCDQAVSGREPSVTGQLIADITVFIDGVDSGGDSLDGITFDTRLVEIVSTAPYGRRIERGTTKAGAPISPVGYGVFESEAEILKREFAGVATIEFNYRSVGGTQDHAAWARGGRHVDMSYPSLVITPRTL